MKIMFSLLSSIASRIAIALGIVFLVTSVIGAIQNFSPVPFWDMWDGYLFFYVRVLSGDYSAWWFQHVDHRIIVSNLFFFIDLRYFDGTTRFLILVNYLLAFATWITLYKIALSVLPGNKLAMSRNLYAGVTLALMFSWIQKENLTWAFQNQMFLTVLFPMLAFLFFYKAESSKGKRSTLYFVGSLVAGTIAAGTMMNGLATLPIMFVMGLLLRTTKARLGLIVALGIAIITLYFIGFKSTSSFLEMLLEQPVNVLTFFLASVGAPAHYIFHDGLSAAVIAGTIIVLGISWFIATSLRRPIENKAVYVVLAILLYMILTCLALAGSRINWGVEYAFTSRYMTNVVVLWGAMMLLLLYVSRTVRFRYGLLVFAFMLAIPAALLPEQLQALSKDSNGLTDRMVAALAIELGVKDKEQIEKIWPFMDSIFILAKTPIERNLSIFGNPIIRDAKKSLGTFDRHHGIECIGDIEAINQIPGDPRFNRLSLWLMNPHTGISPKAFYILNTERKVVGYGVSGYTRYGLTADGKANNAGASAYILAGALDKELILEGRDISCETIVSLPEANQLSPESFSDPKNWTDGVAKNWGPAVLFRSTPSTRLELQVGRRLRFADGTVRTITKIEGKGGLDIVYVDGGLLDGKLIGFPKKILIEGEKVKD